MDKPNYKFFQITDALDLKFIQDAHQSEIDYQQKVLDMAQDFGAVRAFFYNRSKEVAYFIFNNTPDRDIWKKANNGFLPKVSTEPAKLLRDLALPTKPEDVFERYGLANHSVLLGLAEYYTYLDGVNDGPMFLAVPYEGEWTFDLPKSLREVKEWQMMKAIDQAFDA